MIFDMYVFLICSHPLCIYIRYVCGYGCFLMNISGGNTISFAQNFDSVLANEFDEKRFCMLKHNAVDVLGIQNVTFFNGSILDLAFTCEYDILFLDPEWYVNL